MNKRIVTFVTAALSLICLLVSTDAQARNHEKIVGLRAGFTTRNTTAIAGLYFSYRFTEHFRLSPKMDYAFRHHGTDAFSISLDAEIPVSLTPGDNVRFYPIAGLNYSTFSTHSQIVNDDNETIDSSDRSNHYGLNFGAGIEYFATPTLRLALESKCLLMKQNTGGWFTLSIGYKF